MIDLLIYIILAAIGYVITARLVRDKEKLNFIGPLQTTVILLLVLSMGARMGANDEIIANLNKIGLYAFAMTVIVVAGSVFCTHLARKLLKLDRYGRSAAGTVQHTETWDTAEEEAAIEEAGEEMPQGGSHMTIYIVVTVVLGMFIGYLLIHRNLVQYAALDTFAGRVIRVGLCVLLFLVGMDLGVEGTFFQDIKSTGLRILLIPAAVCTGTLGGAAIASLFLPITLHQALSVGAGFGWYSLAPVMIMEKGYITVSAISFMHNVFRELFALLLIPTVARKIGYVEATSLPGSGACDVCLPLIVKSTRSGNAIYSFVTGITVSILVPVLVPLFLG